MGSWKMTTGIEKLLRRMIDPNADLRCTASVAMKDPYWSQTSSENAQISSNRTAHSHSRLIFPTHDHTPLNHCICREIRQYFACAYSRTIGCRCAQDEGYSNLVFALQQGEHARLSRCFEDSHSGCNRQFGEGEISAFICSWTIQRFAACPFSVPVASRGASCV